LLYEVIPVIDILTEKLEKAAENKSLLLAVKSGAMKGLAVLNKYYSFPSLGTSDFHCTLGNRCFLVFYLE